MSREHGRYLVPAMCAAALLAVVACGSSAPSDPSTGTLAAELSTAQAAAVLAGFDRADSAASTAGNIAGLRADEAAPTLDDSIAAVHRAQATHAKQAPYGHSAPVFSIPAGNPGCFLAAAGLSSRGDEVAQDDVSQFIRGSLGTWKLNLHVLIGQSAEPELASIGARPGTLSSAAISAARRQSIVRQIFARTTSTPHPDLSLVASSVVLDQQLGAGWKFYQQGLGAGHMTVSRTLTSSQWSTCAARASGAVIAFVTIYATDTIRPLTGGPATAALTAADPDLIGIGRHTAVRGRSIRVNRVEEFLLSVPPARNAPAAVLGLVDAPISVTAGIR